VEVDELYKENNLQVATDGIATTLLKQGVYGFAANPPKVQVFDGEARVNTGDRQKNVSKGHEAFLSSGVLKETKFNRDPADGLYAWSNLRSEYLSEASVASARTYVAAPGGWYGGGWYYNPWFGAYSFLPGDGYLFSPFGWGFYSPAYAFYAPFYGGYYGHGYRGIPARAVAGVHAAPAFRGGFSGGSGFHGGGGRR
jgi:hypothetical protein